MKCGERFRFLLIDISVCVNVRIILIVFTDTAVVAMQFTTISVGVLYYYIFR